MNGFIMMINLTKNHLNGMHFSEAGAHQRLSFPPATRDPYFDDVNSFAMKSNTNPVWSLQSMDKKGHEYGSDVNESASRPLSFFDDLMDSHKPKLENMARICSNVEQYLMKEQCSKQKPNRFEPSLRLQEDEFFSTENSVDSIFQNQLASNQKHMTGDNKIQQKQKCDTEFNENNRNQQGQSEEERLFSESLNVLHEKLLDENVFKPDNSLPKPVNHKQLVSMLSSNIKKSTTVEELISHLVNFCNSDEFSKIHRTKLITKAFAIGGLKSKFKSFNSEDIYKLLQYILKNKSNTYVDKIVFNYIDYAPIRLSKTQVETLIAEVLDREDDSSLYMTIGIYLTKMSEISFSNLTVWMHNLWDLTKNGSYSPEKRLWILHSIMNRGNFILTEKEDVEELKLFICLDLDLMDKGVHLNGSRLIFKMISSIKEKYKKEIVQRQLLKYIISLDLPYLFEKYAPCFMENIICDELIIARHYKHKLNVSLLLSRYEDVTRMCNIEEDKLKNGPSHTGMERYVVSLLLQLQNNRCLGYGSARMLLDAFKNCPVRLMLIPHVALFIDKVCGYVADDLGKLKRFDMIKPRMSVSFLFGKIDPTSDFFRIHFEQFDIDDLKKYTPQELIIVLKDPSFKSDKYPFATLYNCVLVLLDNSDDVSSITEFISLMAPKFREETLRNIVAELLNRLEANKNETYRKELKNMAKIIISLQIVHSEKLKFLKRIAEVHKNYIEIAQAMNSPITFDRALRQLIGTAVYLRRSPVKTLNVYPGIFY